MREVQEHLTVHCRKADNLKRLDNEAKDRKRLEMFARLADHVSTLADEFVRAINKVSAAGKST